MKLMTEKESKKELVKMLEYFDSLCRKNDIKYSLIGGSMIGAVRHKGMIPWDDDIDIILDIENFNKLIKAFKNESNETYTLYHYGVSNSFFFPFCKLINNNTYVEEKTEHLDVEDYGLFLDIFTYNYTSNNKYFRFFHFKCIKFINSLLSLTDPNASGISYKTKMFRYLKIIISKFLGTRFLHRVQSMIINKYNNGNTDYVVSNWPVYGYKKEIQNSNDIKKYVDIEFDGIKSMIFENYDNILRNTFNNYMELPPEEKRVNHGLKVYWKDLK